jgi:hypothetical protein
MANEIGSKEQILNQQMCFMRGVAYAAFIEELNCSLTYWRGTAPSFVGQVLLENTARKGYSPVHRSCVCSNKLFSIESRIL